MPKTEEMISLAHASAWHWTRRDDVRPKNRAIGVWQLSRVYAEAGRYDEAERYANLGRWRSPYWRRRWAGVHRLRLRGAGQPGPREG